MTRRKQPTVSVALAAYNGERFIRQQVIGILDQDRPIDQLVVADDGSTDSTLDIVRDLVRSRGRGTELVVLEPGTVPLGPTENFVRAVRRSTSEVVILADQDDMWSERRVAAALAHFEQDPAAWIVAHDAQLIDARGENLAISTFDSMGVTSEEIRLLSSANAMVALSRRNVLAGMSFALDRRLLDTAFPIPPGWMHDYWLACWAGARGRLRVVADPSVLFYRQHDQNVYGAGSRRLRIRARRLLTTESDATVMRDRFEALVQRLEACDDVDEGIVDLVRGKRDFERIRAGMPAAPAARFVGVARQAAAGKYAQYGSNGTWNMIRDVIHPPKTEGTGAPDE
ncbi:MULTISPECIES: glycosyltransferase [Nocardioides]|uniref:Glycosyltransferase n=1 Tax=Nocardioides vastitatis TaxID=2568655 RepID=A0ABW0Z8Y7_9ACTN|nr:glycosyltransferase [Nocardioides sp.]THJ02312.1 glycosyltransferase [Nocardioides sp.]